ncbi:MAG: hypothetical protein ABWY25_11685, partial [Paenisporosarcina sp.]
LIFSLLYEEGWISEQEFKFYQTKFSFLHFSSQMEEKFNEVSYAIYLYDGSDSTLWNVSTASVAPEINKYTHGLTVSDTRTLKTFNHNKAIKYIHIPDIEHDNEILLAEHKENLLKYGYHSVFLGLLKKNESLIGLINILFNENKLLNKEEIELFQEYNCFVQSSLLELNDQFITILKNTKSVFD